MPWEKYIEAADSQGRHEGVRVETLTEARKENVEGEAECGQRAG